MRGSNNLIWRNDMQDYFSNQSLGGGVEPRVILSQKQRPTWEL